jgi:hypothetical protein
MELIKTHIYLLLHMKQNEEPIKYLVILELRLDKFFSIELDEHLLLQNLLFLLLINQVKEQKLFSYEQFLKVDLIDP